MKRSILVAFALMLCLSWNASADKLSDFKEATSKEGCEAIPYQSERNTCKDRSRDKDRVCQSFTCNRDEVARDLETYKEKRKNLQDAKDRKDEQAARSLEETIKALETKLNGHRGLAKQRIQNGYDCLETRERVQRSFSDARKMVEDERDAELRPYVGSLIEKYNRGREEHVAPIQQAIKAIDNCKWVSEISW